MLQGDIIRGRRRDGGEWVRKMWAHNLLGTLAEGDIFAQIFNNGQSKAKRTAALFQPYSTVMHWWFVFPTFLSAPQRQLPLSWSHLRFLCCLHFGVIGLLGWTPGF